MDNLEESFKSLTIQPAEDGLEESFKSMTIQSEPDTKTDNINQYFNEFEKYLIKNEPEYLKKNEQKNAALSKECPYHTENEIINLKSDLVYKKWDAECISRMICISERTAHEHLEHYIRSSHRCPINFQSTAIPMQKKFPAYIFKKLLKQNEQNYLNSGYLDTITECILDHNEQVDLEKFCATNPIAQRVYLIHKNFISTGNFDGSLQEALQMQCPLFDLYAAVCFDIDALMQHAYEIGAEAVISWCMSHGCNYDVLRHTMRYGTDINYARRIFDTQIIYLSNHDVYRMRDTVDIDARQMEKFVVDDYFYHILARRFEFAAFLQRYFWDNSEVYFAKRFKGLLLSTFELNLSHFDTDQIEFFIHDTQSYTDVEENNILFYSSSEYLDDLSEIILNTKNEVWYILMLECIELQSEELFKKIFNRAVGKALLEDHVPCLRILFEYLPEKTKQNIDYLFYFEENLLNINCILFAMQKCPEIFNKPRLEQIIKSSFMQEYYTLFVKAIELCLKKFGYDPKVFELITISKYKLSGAWLSKYRSEKNRTIIEDNSYERKRIIVKFLQNAIDAILVRDNPIETIWELLNVYELYKRDFFYYNESIRDTYRLVLDTQR